MIGPFELKIKDKRLHPEDKMVTEPTFHGVPPKSTLLASPQLTEIRKPTAI